MPVLAAFLLHGRIWQYHNNNNNYYYLLSLSATSLHVCLININIISSSDPRLTHRHTPFFASGARLMRSVKKSIGKNKKLIRILSYVYMRHNNNILLAMYIHGKRARTRTLKHAVFPTRHRSSCISSSIIVVVCDSMNVWPLFVKMYDLSIGVIY